MKKEFIFTMLIILLLISAVQIGYYKHRLNIFEDSIIKCHNQSQVYYDELLKVRNGH